ncbi:NACHT domain-containing protein [Nocardiopsis baichengensis]|uniref:NACHT domain-containing protein n=1 Tax=Nocardiopsis baichengensis TaxID=280240 RepID=UPI001377AB21|nr:NACHT domain-containing protein [Nocardiopsis baichengensis]
MTNRRRAWWRAGAAAGLVVLAGSTVALAMVMRAQGLDSAADAAQLVAVGLALAPAAATLLAWWRRPPDPEEAPTRSDIQESAEALAERVADQWEKEAELRSPRDSTPMPVRWRLTERPTLMDLPEAALVEGSLPLEGSSHKITELAEDFRALPRRRLVLLGGAGTGKTTLAVQLLRQLVATRDSAEPVPVLLPVAHWNAESDPDWRDWMADRLRQDYPALRVTALGERAPEQLVRSGYVLPVLDGLDELSDVGRAAVLTALNRSLGDSPLILTSRSAEFAQAVDEADEVLSSAAVVVPQRLRIADVADYLDQCLRTRRRLQHLWAPILTELRTGPCSPALESLREIVRTPLGLWLLRTVYLESRADPSPLLESGRFPSSEQLQDHLLEQLVPATIQTRLPSRDPAETFRPRKHHSPEQLRGWLGYLAHHLDTVPTGEGRHGTRDFAWWELARHVLARRVGFVVGMLMGLTSGFLGGIGVGVVLGPLPGFVFGVILGLCTGLPTMMRFPRLRAALPAFADLHLTGRKRLLIRLVAKHTLTYALPSALLFGIAVWLMFGAMIGLTNWLPPLLLALAVYVFLEGFVIGITKWAESPVRIESMGTPLASWRGDRRLNILRAVGHGLPVGVAMGVISGFDFGFPVGFIGGLIVGLVVGSVFGLLEGHHLAWPVYLVAAFYLAWKRRLPWRLMAVLDDAHRLGLLRAVGPIYQFRHAELHDHLAGAYREDFADTYREVSAPPRR